MRETDFSPNAFKYPRPADGKWFSDSGELLYELPANCILDCARPGVNAETSVNYWTSLLDFSVDRELAIYFLKDFGCWSHRDLLTTSNNELAKRVLWLLCCAKAEYPDLAISLRA